MGWMLRSVEVLFLYWSLAYLEYLWITDAESINILDIDCCFILNIFLRWPSVWGISLDVWQWVTHIQRTRRAVSSCWHWCSVKSVCHKTAITCREGMRHVEHIKYMWPYLLRELRKIALAIRACISQSIMVLNLAEASHTQKNFI